MSIKPGTNLPPAIRLEIGLLMSCAMVRWVPTTSRRNGCKSMLTALSTLLPSAMLTATRRRGDPIRFSTSTMPVVALETSEAIYSISYSKPSPLAAPSCCTDGDPALQRRYRISTSSMRRPTPRRCLRAGPTCRTSGAPSAAPTRPSKPPPTSHCP